MPTTTRAQQRAQAANDYNAFLDVCPSRQLLARIADKWVVLVLCALGDGPMRYSQIARTIAGVSQKMLTQTLRTLERDGLVTRTVTPTVPVTVTYELTELGLSLHAMTRVVRDWAQDHMDDVLAHRAAHDEVAGDGEVRA